MSELQLSDPVNIAILFVGLLLGGVLKGATGAGLPIIAIPVIASVFDIRVAVVLLAIPNFFTNLWQIILYRRHNTEPVFTRNFAIAGGLGAALGTSALAFMPLAMLSFLTASTIILYVVLRVKRPSFKLPLRTASRWVYPVGVVAGVLQGALGLSAPLSITFVHSIQLGREIFIITISVFFAVMSVIQVPVQIWLGLSKPSIVLLGLLALIPCLIGLPIGDYIGKRMNAAVFDKVILALLVVLAIKICIDAIAAF